jgi:hypothetical protein
VNEIPDPSPCHAELTITMIQTFISDSLHTLATAPMLQSRSERVNKLGFDFLLISQHTQIKNGGDRVAKFKTHFGGVLS